MTKKHLIQLFEERKIRAIWDNGIDQMQDPELNFEQNHA